MTGILVNQFPQHTDVGLWTLCRLCVRSHHPIPELWHQGLKAAFFYQSGHLGLYSNKLSFKGVTGMSTLVLLADTDMEPAMYMYPSNLKSSLACKLATCFFSTGLYRVHWLINLSGKHNFSSTVYNGLQLYWHPHLQQIHC